MTGIPNREHPIRSNTVGLIEGQFEVHFLYLRVLHNVTDARPAASVVATNDTTSIAILDLDSIESAVVVGTRSDDGAAHAAIKAAVALEEVVIGCQSFVDVFEELWTTHVASTIGKNSRPMVVKKVLEKRLIRRGSIITIGKRDKHTSIVIAVWGSRRLGILLHGLSRIGGIVCFGSRGLGRVCNDVLGWREWIMRGVVAASGR